MRPLQAKPKQTSHFRSWRSPPPARGQAAPSKASYNPVMNRYAMSSTKEEMIRAIVSNAKNASDYEVIGDMYQEISGFLDSQGIMSEIEIIRKTLESLNKRKLLIPLLIAGFQNDVIDWQAIDSISGAYEDDTVPMLLNSLKKADVSKVFNFFVGE